MARAGKPKKKPGKLKAGVTAIAQAGAQFLQAQGVPVPTPSKKGKGTGKKRMTVAKIKRKIALIKAKKELSKLRGY